MKREDITKVFEGATKEQIDQILNLHSAGVEKAKGDYSDLEKKFNAEKDKTDKLEKDLKALQDLDPDGLQKKVADLQKVIDDRKAEDEKAVYDKNLRERFTTCRGDGAFVNEMTENGIYAEFKAAVELPENKGKNDADIYATITKDRTHIK